MKTGGSHHFAEALLAAFGTVRQRRGIQLLQVFLLEPADGATILVDWHKLPSNSEPWIIAESAVFSAMK
jgi:hypothetical protein